MQLPVHYPCLAKAVDAAATLVDGEKPTLEVPSPAPPAEASPKEAIEVEESPARPAGTFWPDNQLGLFPPTPATPATPAPTPHAEGEGQTGEKGDGEDDQKKDDPMDVEPEKETGKPENENQISEMEEDGDEDDDCQADKPPPPMLSEAAAKARLRRTCQPNSKGEYKVPKQVLEQYADVKGGRLDLEKIFERCAHNPDGVSSGRVVCYTTVPKKDMGIAILGLSKQPPTLS